jgi:hypothetical protein
VRGSSPLTAASSSSTSSNVLWKNNMFKSTFFLRLSICAMTLPFMLLLSSCTELNMQNFVGGNLVGKIKAKQYAKVAAAMEKADQDKLSDAIDQALQSGKAIVVTPLFDEGLGTVVTGGRYRINSYGLESIGTKGGDYSLEVTWQNSATGAVFNLGEDEGLTTFNLGHNVIGDHYQITIVDPGTYKLIGSRHRSSDFTIDDINTDGRIRDSDIGITTFTDSTFDETRMVQTWYGPTYGTRSYDANTCFYVDAGSGQCVSGGVTTQHETVMTSAGGYVDMPKDVSVRGVFTEVKLSKNFASFDVQAGEILLTDSFFERLPDISIKDGQCTKISLDKVNCAMSRYALSYMPASMDRFRQKLLSNIDNKSRFFGIFSKIHYQPLSIAATKGHADPFWMQEYYVSSAQDGKG